jgi:hypothetical protein
VQSKAFWVLRFASHGERKRKAKAQTTKTKNKALALGNIHHLTFPAAARERRESTRQLLT